MKTTKPDLFQAFCELKYHYRSLVGELLQIEKEINNEPPQGPSVNKLNEFEPFFEYIERRYVLAWMSWNTDRFKSQIDQLSAILPIFQNDEAYSREILFDAQSKFDAILDSLGILPDDGGSTGEMGVPTGEYDEDHECHDDIISASLDYETAEELIYYILTRNNPEPQDGPRWTWELN
jgi:hypothetical protein